MRVAGFSSFFAVLVSAALFAAASTASAGAAEGKKIFESKNCGSCHQTVGPAREKTIEDQLKKKAPELWYSGSKFKREFLQAWLADPRPIRPMEYYSLTKRNTGSHPKLDSAGASQVTDYLMSLKSPDVKNAGIQPKGGVKGRVLFEKKQGCYGCHELTKGDIVVGGVTGPTMINIADRLQPDWIYSYLSNPRAFKPVKDMPDYAGILSDEELKTLAAYVATLK
jgi:mono/diheme cytochrome c family protein